LGYAENTQVSITMSSTTDIRTLITNLTTFKDEEKWYEEQFEPCQDTGISARIETECLMDSEYKSLRQIIDKAEDLETEIDVYKSTFEDLGGDHSVCVYECKECGKFRYSMMECCGEITTLHQPLHFIGDAMVEKSILEEEVEKLKEDIEFVKRKNFLEVERLKQENDYLKAE